ncbi:hypothetical protein GCM10027048_28790 [Hymenobacter coalescens]
MGLWVLLGVAVRLPLEATSSGPWVGISIVLIGLSWLWPIALSLHLNVWLQGEALLLVVLRIVLVGFCLLLTWPVLYVSLYALAAASSRKQPWQDERVLYVWPGRPAARVAVQQGHDPTGDPARRVVQLTPVLGLWQLVEPIDTTRFDATGWQRVKE